MESDAGVGGVWEIVLSGLPDRRVELVLADHPTLLPPPHPPPFLQLLFIHFEFNELYWYESSQAILSWQLHTIDISFGGWWVHACGFLCVPENTQINYSNLRSREEGKQTDRRFPCVDQTLLSLVLTCDDTCVSLQGTGRLLSTEVLRYKFGRRIYHILYVCILFL